MSRFNTQVGFGNPASGRRRRQGTPRQGITENIRAPGLTVTPPSVTEGEKLADNLARSLGLAAGVARALGDMSREERAIARGAGARHAASIAPELSQQVETGELAVPDDEDITGYLSRIVSENIPDDAPISYRQEVLDRVVPKLDEQMRRKQATQQRESRDAAASALANGLSGVTDLSEFNDALSTLTGMGMDEKEARAKLGAEAYRFAALSADPDARDAAAEFLGDLEQHKQIEYDLLFERQAASQQRDAELAAENEIAGLLLEDNFGTLKDEKTGEPTGAYALVEQYRGELGDDWALKLRDEIARRQKAYLSDATNTAVLSAFDSGFNEVLSSVSAAIDAGELAYLPSEFTFPLPDGRTRTVSLEDATREVQRQAFAEIAATAESPDDALARQVKWMSHVAPIVKVEEWERQFSQISTAINAIDEDDEESLKIAAAAVTKWGRIHQLNKGVANAHINEENRELARAALFINQEMPDVGLKTALRKLGTSTARVGGVPQKLLDETVADVADDALNPAYVTNNLRQRAHAYVVLSGGSWDSAMKQAAKDFKEDHTKIDGTWERTAGAPIPPNVNEVVDAAKRWFVGAKGEALDVAFSDVTTRRDENGTWWFHWKNGDMVLPIDGAEQLTDADMLTISAVAAGDDRLRAMREGEKSRRERRRREAASSASSLRRLASTMPAGRDIVPTSLPVFNMSQEEFDAALSREPDPEFSDIPENTGATARKIIENMRKKKPQPTVQPVPIPRGAIR